MKHTPQPISRAFNAVLVTGGCGFIGSAFVRQLLSDPHFAGKIINLDLLTYAGNPDNVAPVQTNPRYSFELGDVCDEALVESLCVKHDVDCIVHFAAESHVDRSILGPAAFIQTNIIGTFRLLEVARRNRNIHFHHVSTDEVYGSLGAEGYFREDTAYHPNSPYAASKAASDHLVHAYGHTYGLSTTVSNCSNNYGPYQFPEKLIPLMISNMLEGQPLPVYGDGLNVRDWLHVEDHVEAVWAIAQRGELGRTYNIGGNCELTNLQLIDRLLDAVAMVSGKALDDLRQLIRFVPDRPGHDRRYAIDSSFLERELHWTPKRNIEEGLLDTVRWYVGNGEWVSRVRSGAYRAWLEQNYGAR